MNWKAFKETKFAIKCEAEKEKFFSACAKQGINIFLGERAMLRNYFICRLCFKDQFSDGRYELMSLDEWQAKENGFFGKQGLEIIEFQTKGESK